MTGKDLNRWIKEQGLRPEQIASTLGISVATFYKWHRLTNYLLDNRTVMALAHLGCPQALKELEVPKIRAGLAR